VSFDDSTDGLNKKVRNAETDHVNYILVVGEQEQNKKTLAVRNYKTKEQSSLTVDAFIQMAQTEIREKHL
jgi:threonyl-tRNA synthetase